MAGFIAISDVVLCFCLFTLVNHPTEVQGCSCIPVLSTLTKLQLACRDFRFARNVFTARVLVVSRECFSTDCSFFQFNYTLQVVDVFKGHLQVRMYVIVFIALIYSYCIASYLPSELL